MLVERSVTSSFDVVWSREVLFSPGSSGKHGTANEENIGVRSSMGQSTTERSGMVKRNMQEREADQLGSKPSSSTRIPTDNMLG